jgi:hypothetical protein
MAPSKKKILARIHRLPEHLQKPAREALEKPEENFSNISHSDPPPGTQSPAAVSLILAGHPGATVPWPGYIWFLQTAPLLTLASIVLEGNYYLLEQREREIIRERLKASPIDITRWRAAGLKPRDVLPAGT